MSYRFLCCIVLDWPLIYFICPYGIVFDPRFILSISIDVWYLIYRISKSLIRYIDTYNILFDVCIWRNNCAPFWWSSMIIRFSICGLSILTIFYLIPSLVRWSLQYYTWLCNYARCVLRSKLSFPEATWDFTKVSLGHSDLLVVAFFVNGKVRVRWVGGGK